MNDPYYQTLPFTLSEQQLDYDYVLLGTNLQACMIAAHLSKIQKKRGLILQLEKGYGGDIKSMSLKELHEFMTNKKLSIQENAPLLFRSVLTQSMMQKNQSEIDSRKQLPRGLRGYNIDLQPKVFCGSSLACEMLKQANMDQYMDFRLIKKVLFVLNGKLQQVPLNLKTIMSSQGLSLLERKDLFKGIHQLVKTYYKYHSVEADNNSTNQFDKDTDVNEQLYSLFLQQKNNNCSKFLMKVLNNRQRLFDMVMFGICGYQHRIPHKFIQHHYSALEMLKKFGRFVKSCGVYSQTPYLYVDNGIGDIPQAYSRISSIFGGAFIIHPRIEITSISKQQNGYEIKSNLAPDTVIKTQTIKYTDPYYDYIGQKLGNKTDFIDSHVLRVVLIYKKANDFKYVGPLIVHNFQNKKFINPVTCFLFDSQSSTTPQTQYLLHITTVIQSIDQIFIQEQIQLMIGDFKQLIGESQLKYMAAYIQTNKHLRQYGDNAIRNDWNFDVQGSTEIFKQIIGQQIHYFKQQTSAQQQLQEEQGYYQGLLNKLDNLKVQKTQNQNQNQQQTNTQNQTKVQEVSDEINNTKQIKQKQPEISNQTNQNNLQSVEQPKSQNQNRITGQIVDQQNKGKNVQEQLKKVESKEEQSKTEDI